MERTPIRELLEPLQIPSQKWQSISIDWISGLPTSDNGNDCILTIVERLTHMIHLIPCRTTLTSPQLAHLLIQNVVRLHGVPRSIHSDRDPKLVARFWKELCRQLGIVHKYTTAYHPSSNGLVERMNRSVEQVLRTLLDSSTLEKWEDKLPLVEMAINNSNLFHCEYSPFYLNYGFHTCLVHDVAERNRPSQNEDVDAFISRIDKDLDRYTGILVYAQRNMKIQADRLRKSVEFKIGDKVLFKQSRLEKAAGTHAKYAKLRPKSIGPFTIVKFLGHNVVELDNPILGLNSKNINVSFLSPYNSPDEDVHVETEDDVLTTSSVENVDMLYHYNGDVKPQTPEYSTKLVLDFNTLHNIDMFASRIHHQLDDYCSLQPDSEAHHKNCFELNWSEYFPYLNPPWEEILKTLLKVKRDKKLLVYYSFLFGKVLLGLPYENHYAFDIGLYPVRYI